MFEKHNQLITSVILWMALQKGHATGARIFALFLMWFFQCSLSFV
jgi:hypothetical protein